MIGHATLSQAERKELTRIKKGRKIKHFCAIAGINYRTFNEARTADYSNAQIIAKIRAALQPPADEATVLRIVSTQYGLTRQNLLTKSRKPAEEEPKQVAILLLAQEAKLSHAAIGRLFNYPHPWSSVPRQIATIQGRIDVEDDVRATVEHIKEKVRAAA